MNFKKIFISSILAGFCIGLGGMLFLAMDDKVIGASLFSTGLFVICTNGYHLFTGKVCYAFQNDASYAVTLPVIWIGNLIGTGGVAAIVRLSRAKGLAEKAASICEVKANDSLLSLFLLGILCNIFIFIAVDGFKNDQHEKLQSTPRSSSASWDLSSAVRSTVSRICFTIMCPAPGRSTCSSVFL